MVLEIDPDKPDIPSMARILSGAGVLCLLGTVLGVLLAFSGYPWVNEAYAMAGAVGAFLLALVFVGQAKILELLAVVSARLKSRFAIEGAVKGLAPAASTALPPVEKKPVPITQATKERVIHVPDDQARQQGFTVR